VLGVSPSRTAHSTLRLSEVARHVVVPKGITTTAWPRVVDKCAELGVTFDAWQHGAGSIALGKRKDGKYAATVGGIVLSVPRQVGKTFLVGMILIALCLLFPGYTVLWTAHRTRTATKTFQTVKALTSRKKIKPHMLEPRNTNGEQEVRFRNGSVIMFGAREQGFGRGFDEVDAEVFDEAQILSEKALEDMVPAANQSRHEAGALLFFMGTPPRPTDPGDEFKNRRRRALAGKTDSMVYIEFSADPDADLDDRKQWSKANPSYPLHTPLEAMLRMRENLTDGDSFRREALGIWDEELAEHIFDPFPIAAWNARARDVHPSGPPQFFITVEKAQRSAYIAVAADHDGVPHVGEADYRPGVAWLTGRVRELKARWPNAEFGAYSAGPVKAWAPLFAEFDVELELLSQPQSASAFAHMKKLVDTAEMTHSPTQVFADALKAAAWREGNAGAFDLDWRKSEGDPGPFAAAAGALWLLESVPQLGQPSVYYV
jgi:hypothetical protein